MWYFVGLNIQTRCHFDEHIKECAAAARRNLIRSAFLLIACIRFLLTPMLCPTLFVEMTFLYLYLINYFKTGRFIKPAGLL